MESEVCRNWGTKGWELEREEMVVLESNMEGISVKNWCMSLKLGCRTRPRARVLEGSSVWVLILPSVMVTAVMGKVQEPGTQIFPE